MHDDHGQRDDRSWSWQQPNCLDASQVLGVQQPEKYTKVVKFETTTGNWTGKPKIFFCFGFGRLPSSLEGLPYVIQK